MSDNYIFTSESVTEGHPDKIADQISDAVLDAVIEKDPYSRVACETMVTTGQVILAGEISSKARVDFQEIIRSKINEIGYNHSDAGFDGNTCGISLMLDKQSPDIAQGVNEGKGLFKEQGAGDQGIMFGYAINETESYMPLTIDLSHRLAQRLSYVRREGIIPFLLPDGKTQVSCEYADGKISRISAVVVSTQHLASATLSDVQEAVMEEVVKKTISAQYIDDKTKYFINPTGRFVVGGPMGDCGLTGRKIIVDTYGGHGGHGGGAFSGKDPTKVDRSAAYAVRQVAKHIVASGAAERVLVQVAYAIGVTEPVSLFIDPMGTEKVDKQVIRRAVRETFDLRSKAIIEKLQLLNPIYSRTAAYGHFGRKPDSQYFTWEKLPYLDDFKGKIS